MKKKHTLRRVLIAVAIVVVVILGILGGASSYLLSYALQPGDRSRQEGRAWHEMDSLYPGLISWRDSLVAARAWHDTTIQATDGTVLHAYYIRRGQPTARTALLIHGHTDCAVRMMQLGRMYERDLGANLLVPDLRNAGKSGGDHFGMGWPDRLDMKRWLAVAPHLFGDSLSVIVHGVSMGAATTMMLSGEPDVPRSVKAYVEDCGYTSVEAQFSKELHDQFGLPSWPLIPMASKLCQWRYGWNFREASSLNQVKRCHRPMLFIHGTADTYVPTAMVYELYAAHPGPKALYLAPGAPHARSYREHPAEYTRRVKAFARQYAGWRER